MPRTKLHVGRPGSRVVPTGWAEAHRPTVATSWNGAITIRDPESYTEAWDNGLEQNVQTPAAAYYTGAARIQQLTGRGTGRAVIAADPEQVADYLVVVDADTEVAEGHAVTVVTADDARLEGREMTVVRVATGTERFERDLFCELVD